MFSFEYFAPVKRLAVTKDCQQNDRNVSRAGR